MKIEKTNFGILQSNLKNIKVYDSHVKIYGLKLVQNISIKLVWKFSDQLFWITLDQKLLHAIVLRKVSHPESIKSLNFIYFVLFGKSNLLSSTCPVIMGHFCTSIRRWFKRKIFRRAKYFTLCRTKSVCSILKFRC